jgi:hypothetical protein
MQPRDQLQSLLNDVRRRWRTSVALRLAGRASLSASICLLAAFALASVLQPRDTALLAIVGTLLAIAGGVAFVVLRGFGHRPSDARVARFVEERVAAIHGHAQVDESAGTIQPFDDVLVSAVADEGDGAREGAPAFQALVVRSAARQLQAFGVDRIVPVRAIVRGAGEALGGAAALGVAVTLTWPILARAAEAAWIAVLPRTIDVRVVPGDVRMEAGKPLTIRATVHVRGKSRQRFGPSLTVTAGDEARTVSMAPDGEGFQFSFASVDRTFRYRVTAGAARSQDYTVTALVGARVERIDLRYVYPPFAAQPPRDEEDGGDIYAPAGTRVRVRVHTDKPVSAGSLGLAASDAARLTRIDDRLLEGDVLLASDDSYRVALTDRDGLQSSDDTEYFIRVMTDRPPEVRIVRPGGDQQITPLEEVAIEARAEDDHGLSRFELVYSVAGRQPKVVPFSRTGGTDLARLGSYLLAAEDLRVQPGDVIAYYAKARDIGRGARATETRSDMFFLEVRPFSEEFVAAQSQGMAGMAGDQIDSLIAAQKEIIAATWNIDRRAASGAGRSASDISAIADAQAELKARAEQLASRGASGRRVFPLPQQMGPRQSNRPARSASDPVGGAISAMARAVDQLNGARTTDALPHEMAALQGLLQAQSEIRRREVSQRAGAGAGMGRQGQDLSALFDRELQRHQRTNYETRSQLEERPRRDGETALDRIRELARRQEELSGRHRDLAKADLPAEERKRQLETLTREQTKLREQAEEIARQMGAQPGAPSEGKGGGSEVRGASDQMRDAATDLQRQDPASAADRAEKAASRLRRLEQRMQQDSPDERQRSAGELRLDAQQIADEQRRIANEVERFDGAREAANGDARAQRGRGTSSPAGQGASEPDGPGRAAGPDAWRRIAGEKDALADRVDELKRSAERLAAAQQQAGQTSESGQTATAARDIDQQRLSSRMREGATQMRGRSSGNAAGGRGPQPAPRTGAADAERQIARSLDEVVEHLGGSAGSAEGDVSRQLDRTQAIRNRLDALERQIRASEGKEPAASERRSGQRSDLQRLQEEYAKELRQARETLSRLEQSAGAGHGGATPEAHEWSVTDQGTEAFKQDFARWESLRKDVDSALERYEQSIVRQAARKGLEDRLSGGGSERVPDAYRQLISRYYESLARKK